MKSKQPVLVVGTTADYIDWIRRAEPGRALFLTDPAIRREAQEPQPGPAEEILCDLTDADKVHNALRDHIRRWNLSLSGVACFDCESMELAAMLAHHFSLPYPSVAAICRCRDKYLSKVFWQQNGVKCPGMQMVRSAPAAAKFLRETGGPIVLKPLSGSGSELVFRCDSDAECETAFHAIVDGIESRRQNRLYADAEAAALAEEYVSSDEYSCDFLLEGDRVEVVRMTRKIRSQSGPFGTIEGYVLVDSLPDPIAPTELAGLLHRGAKVLGLSRALCMADFLVRGDEVLLLEMTPRPGGDCLPPLLRSACHLDMLMLSLDFAQQRPIHLPDGQDRAFHVGLRLHAKSPGVVREIDSCTVRKDSRLREIHLIRAAGHQVRMPPEDYNSWYLGHLIFQPTAGRDVESQCHELAERLVVTIEAGK